MVAPSCVSCAPPKAELTETTNLGGGVPSRDTATNTTTTTRRGGVTITIFAATPPPYYIRNRRPRCHVTLPSIHPKFLLAAFVFAMVLGDYVSLISRDHTQTTWFEAATGVSSLVPLTAHMALHTVAFFAGISKRVFGCRLAMAIMWFFMVLFTTLLIVAPAAIGSYAASGYDVHEVSRDTVTVGARTQDEAGDVFISAFVMALIGQAACFVAVLGYMLQVIVCIELLREALIIQAQKKKKAAAGDEQLLV